MIRVPSLRLTHDIPGGAIVEADMQDQNRGVSLLGDNLVFLIGLPRSGTTLLSRMLGNHPAIVAPPEPWVMLALHQLGRVDARHPANAWAIQRALETFAAGDGLIAASRASATALYNARLANAGKSILIDKTPRYLFIIDYLRAVFPRAKFLCLLRDPFDIAASFRSTFRVNLADVLAELQDVPYLYDFAIGVDRLDRFISERNAAVHVVRYEDLVTDPTRVLSGVVEALGVPADPELIEGMCKLEPRQRQPGEFGDRNIEQTQAPHADSIGGYRRAFMPHELQELLDSIGLDRLNRLGYGKTATELTELGLRERPAVRRLEKDAKIEAMFRDRLAGPSYIPIGKGSYLRRLRRMVRSLRWYRRKR